MSVEEYQNRFIDSFAREKLKMANIDIYDSASLRYLFGDHAEFKDDKVVFDMEPEMAAVLTANRRTDVENIDNVIEDCLEADQELKSFLKVKTNRR